MSSWHSSRDIFELIFFFLMKCRRLLVLEAPLRQKAPWDLTLTCRTLTSYWVHSLVRSWRSKSQGRSKSSGGFIWSQSCLSSQTEHLPATVGFILNASPKAWDSPGLSSPAPLSLVCGRILSVSVLRGWGRWRDEGMEWERGDGRPLGEKGSWTQEHCWEAGGGGGGGSSRMDLSSSSCLRKCLFSPLRAFNWKKRERDICRRQKTENNIILDTKPLWPWNRLTEKGRLREVSWKFTHHTHLVKSTKIIIIKKQQQSFEVSNKH